MFQLFVSHLELVRSVQRYIMQQNSLRMSSEWHLVRNVPGYIQPLRSSMKTERQQIDSDNKINDVSFVNSKLITLMHYRKLHLVLQISISTPFSSRHCTLEKHGNSLYKLICMRKLNIGTPFLLWRLFVIFRRLWLIFFLYFLCVENSCFFYLFIFYL